jgi:hypothetical protein
MGKKIVFFQIIMEIGRSVFSIYFMIKARENGLNRMNGNRELFAGGFVQLFMEICKLSELIGNITELLNERKSFSGE